MIVGNYLSIDPISFFLGIAFYGNWNRFFKPNISTMVGKLIKRRF